jgi:outer membrane lipoprotein-sorting protein
MKAVLTSIVIFGLCLPAAAGLTGPGNQRPPAGETALDLPVLDQQERLSTILARFDQAQASIHTLQADFSERKEVAMLKDPVESEGRFFYASPDQAKWEHVHPEERVFLITDNKLMQYYPDRKLLEQKDLSTGNTNRLFKLFGMGQTSRELKDLYDISLGEPEEGEQAYLLILTPRRRAVRKRLSRVLLWVGDRSFLPHAMKLEEANGDFTYWTFKNVLINAELAQNTFQLDLPEDVQIRDEFRILSPSKGSSL